MYYETTTGERYCMDEERVRRERKAMENIYNVCNCNANEPKQGKALTPKAENMTDIEKETMKALETANSVLNFCLRTICFGDAEEGNEIQPECLIDLQRYNREMAQKVVEKAIKIKEIITES